MRFMWEVVRFGIFVNNIGYIFNIRKGLLGVRGMKV